MKRINPIWQQVLDNPLVQYIPLSKDPIITRTDYPRVTGSQLNIRAFNTPEDLRPTLNRFGLDMEILRMVNWERELPIISINMESKELMYRTNKVVVLAESQPKYLELFSVNRGISTGTNFSSQSLMNRDSSCQYLQQCFPGLTF